MNETFDVRLDRLVYGGDSIGRMDDGRAIFVPFTIPGEMVRARLVEEKRNYARAELVEIIEPSPRRTTACCSHFTQCGGCHYQHLGYPDQLSVKSAILREQLERIGGLIEIPSIEVIPAKDSWNYRNHVQFHLTSGGKPGFVKSHSTQTFAIQECHIPEVSINQLWPQIDIEPIPGLERIKIRSGWSGDLMVVLENSMPEGLDFSIENFPVSVIQSGPSGNLVLTGSDHLFIQVLEKKFRVSCNVFFQVNTLQACEMVKHLIANLPLGETTTAIDMYCGVGLFSAFLAPKVKKLVGIEVSADACADFCANLDEFDHVSLYEATAEQVLSNMRIEADVIVMDPPREGLGRKTVDGILSQGAATLAYVSCDPATLARDAKRLVAGGYRLEKIALCDMFPQTYHIESISYWGKSNPL